MAIELSKQECTACRADAPKLSAAEINALKPQLPEWEVITVNGELQLQRQFRFDDFISALRFTDKIGLIAEAAAHHPAILTEWGKVTVAWWTHKIHGLHQNDFIMAAKTDKEYSA